MTMMLQGPDSTVRIEVLGEELRRLREACGLTLSQVVSRIGISESHLSRMEMGKRAPSPEDISALLVIYGVTGVERLEMLSLAKKSGQPCLWQRNGTFESRFATLKIHTSSLFLEEHRDIAVYDKVIVELLSMAMDEEDSVRLMAEMAATLE